MLSYLVLTHITEADLFDGRLERFDVREHFRDLNEGPWISGSDPGHIYTSRMLTDGYNYVWVTIRDGLVYSLYRYYPNDARYIIWTAIAETFHLEVVPEQDSNPGPCRKPDQANS